jgi:hypothetical protein
MNTDYKRVLPRDLFNEAKLLNSLGRVTLLIHYEIAHKALRCVHEGDSFIIGLTACGHLILSNVTFYCGSTQLVVKVAKTAYNSREIYPLLVEYEGSELYVFDHDGYFSRDFSAMCEALKDS